MTWPYLPQEDVEGCHRRLVQRIAMLCGVPKAQASEIAGESMRKFIGHAMDENFADTIVDWTVRRSKKAVKALRVEIGEP